MPYSNDSQTASDPMNRESVLEFALLDQLALNLRDSVFSRTIAFILGIKSRSPLLVALCF